MLFVQRAIMLALPIAGRRGDKTHARRIVKSMAACKRASMIHTHFSRARPLGVVMMLGVVCVLQ